jgi:hypothetical protein
MYLKDIKTFKLVEEAVKNLVPRVQKFVPDIALVGGEYYAKLEVDEEGLSCAPLSNVSA